MNRYSLLLILAIASVGDARAQASSSVLTDSPKHTFLSPQQAAVAGGPSGATTGSSNPRCKELAASIDRATVQPQNRTQIVSGYSSEGKPRTELRTVDQRAELETEYMRLGCR